MSFVSRVLTRRFLSFLLLFSSPGLVLPADRPAVPAAFEQLVPAMLGNGLALVELRERCEDCPPWRAVEFRSRGASTPAWREKVSVRAGVTAMYAYPGSDHFANVKVEQSMPGMYEQDKRIVDQAIDHEFRRADALLAAWLEANPAAREKVRARLAPGEDIMAFERRTVKGIEVVGYTTKLIGLTGGTISQVHFFVPARAVIVTAYLLNQKRANFADIGEFLRLRDDFIRKWADFLARSGALVPVGGGAGSHAGEQQQQGSGLEAVRPARLPQEPV